MKSFVSFLSLIALVSLAALVLVTPVFALDLSQATEAELTVIQLYTISVVASAVIYVVNLVARRGGWDPSAGQARAHLSVGLYVVAAVLAYSWSAFTVPAFAACSEPVSCVSSSLNYLSDWLVVLAPFAGTATLIYNLLGKKVFDAVAEKVGAQPVG